MARTAAQDMSRAIKASADQPRFSIAYSALGISVVCLAVKAVAVKFVAVIFSVAALIEKSSRSLEQRRLEEITNVLGAPAITLATFFWETYLQLASRRLLKSIADPVTQKSLTDILYMLECVDDFQYIFRTDLGVRTRRSRALLRGTLAPFIQSSQITMGTSLRENLAQLTASVAFEMRLRREPKRPHSWLVVGSLFMVVTLVMAKPTMTLPVLITLIAPKISKEVLNFNLFSISHSDRVCGRLIATWLWKIDRLYEADVQGPSNKPQSYHWLLDSHIPDSEFAIGEFVGWNLECRTVRYNSLKVLTDLKGYHSVLAPSDEQADIFEARLKTRPSMWFVIWMFSQPIVGIVLLCLLNFFVKTLATDVAYLRLFCMAWYFFGIVQWLVLGAWQNPPVSVRVVFSACSILATISAPAVLFVHVIENSTFYLQASLVLSTSNSQRSGDPTTTWLLPVVVMLVSDMVGFFVLWWNILATTEQPQSKPGPASFLTKSGSFSQKHIRSEPNASRQDQKQVDFEGTAMQAAQAPSEVQSQQGRIEWKCKCGAALSDVYCEIVPGSLRVLQQRLQKESTNVRNQGLSGLRSFTLTALSKSVSSQSSGASANPDSNRPGSTSKQNSNLGSAREISANDGGNTTPGPIPQPTIVSASTKPHAGAPKISYLLLCLPEAWAGFKLHHQQLITTSAKNDFELFRLLRQVYGSKRSVLASVLSLRTVVSISFAHFLVDLSHYVDLKPHSSTCQPSPQDCKCLPPQDMLVPATNAEYWCHPTQPEYVPPIGPNYLTHCFRNPGCIDRQSDWVLNQVPKRVSGQLMALSGSRPARGWGLAFEEGWDRTKIRNGLFGSVILGTFIFGILWSVFKKDIQSAYGVSAYAISVLAIIGAYLGSAEPRLVLH